MKRAVKVLDAAAEEVAQAAAWYEHQREGLGFEFQEAIDAALDLLEDEFALLTPVPGVAGKRDARRLKRFPYSVIVREHGSEFVLVAFAHRSKRPGYWRDRLSA